MDAASTVVTVPASSATASATTTPAASNAINVNQSNNHNIHTHANTHSGTNSLSATTNSSNSSNGNISIVGNSSNSNSSCSSSSTSSNSSGYGSTTTTPTNNYDLQQQTTPTTTPIPTTPVAIAEPIIPIATVAAVTPFYNESITTHNLQTHQQQHHTHHTQQQQLQQHQHQLLQTNHQHQLPQNHLQTNLQPQQLHHQYLSRQQYYSTYDYQQPTPTHNLSGSSALPAAAAYNVGVTGPYELNSPTYGSGQYKSSSLTGAINYERAVIRTNAAPTSYNHHHQQQQQQSEQQQSKTINQQTQQFPAVLASSKQRSSSLISNSTSTNTSKPQAAATPFYAQPLSSQSHSNATPFYDSTKYKMPLEYRDSYSHPSAAATATYHQQQKYYAAAKSQLKEAAYGAAAGLNSKPVYPNTANFFSGPSGNHGLTAASYDKYMYPHSAATSYSATGHLGNETPPEISNYRKPVVTNSMNSPSWPWGIDYATGNSRTIPPPASHLPTATVAPTHATYLQPNPTALTRDPYYMAHDKYTVKYDKYAAPSYQQSYVSPPASRHNLWPSTPHASNLTQINERHLLATGPTVPPSHGLHTATYFSSNSTAGLNSRQSCCSQPYQPQSCYYPSSHPIPSRLPHNQSPSMAAPSSGYLPSQQTLGQSPHLNALSASCKYGGVIPDYGNGNKIKNSNDLYLNAHHYDNNTSPHNYDYGSANSSQQLYASNAHQPMAHGLTSSSLLTHDPLNANPASYTNDLSLPTSNFENFHTHLDTHLSPQTLAEIHSQQPPPAYAPTVAKRALLDYRKPIQPQPPPTVAEDCYTTLSSRDHYNQQELLNTPETTTTFGEYEVHQDNAANLSSYSHPTEAQADVDKALDESNKSLSLRDFIVNWNDDEDEYQNNEELHFDQATVIDEVLQTAPVEQVAKASAADDVEIMKTSSLDSKNTEHSLLKSHKIVENLDTQTLNNPDVNQYVNLPDIVIDIEKSNNINNSITTPLTSPTPNTQQEANNTTSPSLNLNNFDVEKELDELKLKKPSQQELTKDLKDIKDSKSVITPQLSPCKNLTTQLSFEDLNLEPANKTVLNATIPITRLTNNQSTELTENYFKDMEGYESGCSHHSNESAFEKEYETFINKITSDATVNKKSEDKSVEANKDIDFEQNVHDFSKFYKRKRKLKEDELKIFVPETQSQKKFKTNVTTKVNNSNFPQVYTKKSRNRLTKTKQQSPHKRKPLSVYYKVIHSIRRFGLHRSKRVREYMTELKEKHLPLIKRQSIKNYTHGSPDNQFNAKSLKALCIMAVNTNEFRQSLILSLAEDRESCLETEEKHICTDPTCETCEVIKSLMEAESFEDTLMQQVCENNTETAVISSAIFSEEDKNGTITIVDSADNISLCKEVPTMISNEIVNDQYSKENLTENLQQEFTNPYVIKSLLNENSNYKTETEILLIQNQIDVKKTETEFNLENWYETSKSTEQDLQTKEYTKTPMQPVSESTTNCNMETSPTEQENLNPTAETSNCNEVNQLKEVETAGPRLSSQTDDETTNISTDLRNDKNLEIHISAEFHDISNATFKTKENAATVTKNQESESEDSDSSESDTNSSSSSDDESVDDSKDSHKKSDNNDNSSDTDSESDLENDDEKYNSDSNQSYHSVKNNREQNDASRVSNELNNTFDLSKSKNLKQSSDSIYKEMIDPIKESAYRNQGKMKLDVNTDSYTDEIIPKSPQHIVIRIKKSFKNNSKEIYVSENSVKSYAKFDNRTDSESEDGEISEKECEVISTTLKLSPKLKNSLVDHDSEKSVSSDSELENQTESESEDDEISKKKIKLSPKEENLVRKQLLKPHTELDNHTESESEDDEILEKESKMVSKSLELSSMQEGSLEDHKTEKLIEPNTELDNHTESESEDDDISEKGFKKVSSSFELSFKQENAIEDLAYVEPIESQTQSDNHTEREDGDIFEKESEIVLKTLKVNTKEEDSIAEGHAAEKSKESQNESDNYTESESDNDNISEKEMLSNDTKKDNSIENYETEKTIEPRAEADNHTESESVDDDILEEESEKVLETLKVNTKEEYSIVEDLTTEKSIELHNESDIHTESEFDDDDISEKEIVSNGNKKDNSVENYETEKAIQPHNHTDNQSESEDEEISHNASETINKQIGQEYKDNDNSEKNAVLISTSLKFTPKQEHLIDQCNSPKPTEFESHSENPTKCDILDVDLEKETVIYTTISDLSPTPHNSIEESVPEKCENLLEKTELFTQTSILSSKLQVPKEVLATEYAESNTELDNYTTSESEDDTDDEEDLQLKLSNKKVQLKEAEHKIVLSDSESSSDSESDEEYVAMREIKKTNDSMPIIKSDNESLDSCDNDNQISKKETEDSQEVKSDAELTDSNDSVMSLIDGDSNDLMKNSQEIIINKDSNFASNKLELKPVNDSNIEELRATDKTETTNEPSSPYNVIECVDEFASNINSLKYLLLDSAEINKTQAIDDENICEKYISEYSSFSEDSDAEMDDKLSTKDEKVSEVQLLSKPLLQNIEEKESIKPERFYNYSECEKNTDFALDSHIPDAILDNNFSKRNQNSLEMPGCESKPDNYLTLEKSESAIYLPEENELLQESKELNESSNTLEENSIIPDISSEQTHQKEVKNFTTEPGNTTNYLENDDQHKLRLEGSSIINTIDIILEESNSQCLKDHAESFESIKKAKTEESSIQEDSNSPTLQTNNEIAALEEIDTNSKAITEEPILLDKSFSEIEEFNAYYMLKDIHSETANKESTTLDEICCNKPFTDEPTETESIQSEINDNGTNAHAIIDKLETTGLSADINNEPSGTLKEIHDESNTNTELLTETPEIITQAVTNELDYLQKVNWAGVNDESCNRMDITDENTNEQSEFIAKSITKKSNILQAPFFLKRIAEIYPEATLEVLNSDSQKIPGNVNNRTLEDTQNTPQHSKTLDKSETLSENTSKHSKTLNESETFTKLSDDEANLLNKDFIKPLESLEPISATKEVEPPETTLEDTIKKSELTEELNNQTLEDFEDKCEETNKSLDNFEDSDIFKEVIMQEDFGTSKTKLDENESHDTSLIKDSGPVYKTEGDKNTSKAINQQAECLEEIITKNTKIVLTTSDQIKPNTTGFEYSFEGVTEKPNVSNKDELRRENSYRMLKCLSESEAVIEETNKLMGNINKDSENSHQCISLEVEDEEPDKLIKDKHETSECYKEDFGAFPEYRSKSEEKENQNETSEYNGETAYHSRECITQSDCVCKKPNRLACYEEDPSLSKLETRTSKSSEVETGTHYNSEEQQAENLELGVKESLNENSLVLDLSQKDNASSENNEQESAVTLTKDNELESKKYQADLPPLAEHQLENIEPSLNESLVENVSNKDSNPQEDLSVDFLGFKNQSSFEDESEDFHGFEDLEEVARIRQEIENLNDDSTANDGFLNYVNLNRDLHKSSTTSLTGSTTSEINELEALEKELSQHRPELVLEDEDEDIETENELQTAAVKVVSTNDIEHIKNMLESDEEQQHDETDQGEDEERTQQIKQSADNDKSKDKFVKNSKEISNDILSSVNSIIPKLSDLCRAALNSSLNSNSNLAQHTETPTILVERELSVEEALAEMYRQAGVLLSDPEDYDNDLTTNDGNEEAHDVLLINLQEILNSDNNDVYVLQCNMNEHLLNAVQQTAEESGQGHSIVDDTERVNTVQFIGILDTQNTEPQIHIISSDSESEVIILSDDETDFGYRPFIARQERITIPFINDSDSLSDISTIHHEEIVPDNLNKFLQEEFYKYLHEKYVQRNISKYYHANRVLKKYRKRFVKTKRQ